MSRNIQYPVEAIRGWIAEGKTQQWIADELAAKLDPRISAKLIYKVCKKHGIECQRTGPRSGEGHPEWSGGRILCKNGYYKVYMPDHHSLVEKNRKREAKSNGCYYRKNHYVWEHRLMMEAKLGRNLLPSEVVHHIDNNPSNNHPDNLELFASNGKHLRETLVGCVPKWTDTGKENIRSGQTAEHRQSLAILRHAIQRESGASAPLSNPEIRRYLKKLGKSAIEACEMVSRQELPPFDDRPKH